MAGYSGTALVKKLGIKEDFKIYVKNAPPNYHELLEPVPAGVIILEKIGKEIDLIHLFTKKKSELPSQIKSLLIKIKQNGSIWVSWPKKSAHVQTDITENVIREIILPLGLVDVKVCAVDDTWSGLKLVIRKENRI